MNVTETILLHYVNGPFAKIQLGSLYCTMQFRVNVENCIANNSGLNVWSQFKIIR